jgi:uncharacterized membrane protein
MNNVLILILLTLLPALELRASIPYGILIENMNWLTVFLICVITNAILGPVIFIIIDKFIHVFLRVKHLERMWDKTVERTQKRIHKYIERWGILGLSIFIGIPLPGSGSYTGAIAAYLLGFRLKRFIIANIIGVLIAGTIVTILVLTGGEMFRIFLRI